MTNKNELLATAATTVALFGAAVDGFTSAMREASIAVLNLIVEGGEDTEAALTAAKNAYGYSSASDKKKGTFRQWASDIRKVSTEYDKVPADVREALLNGDTPMSAVAKSLRDGAKEAKEAPAAPVEQEAAPDAKHILTRGEIIVHAASLLETMAADGYTDAEAAAISMLLDAVEAFKASEVEAAREQLAA